MLAPVTDPADWATRDLSSGAGWRYHLSADEITALRSMAADVRPALQGDANTLLGMDKTTFDLGAFKPTLGTVFAGLRDGLGIALIKGLPLTDMDALEAAIIYWAIGTHLGNATPNNPEGDMFGHITDLGKTQADANSRGYQTRELMDYHCDQCDLVGLLCLRTARSGGTSMLASSVSMFNALVQEHPDYAAALTEPLCWSKMGEFPKGELPYYESPVFNFAKGRLSTSFGPKHIEKGHALEATPDLSALQRAAIRQAEEIAHDQRFEMELERGDMQFANNYVTLHTRSEYEDFDDPAQKRLLWRLWLMNPDLRHRTAYSTQFQGGIKLGAGHQQIRI